MTVSSSMPGAEHRRDLLVAQHLLEHRAVQAYQRQAVGWVLDQLQPAVAGHGVDDVDQQRLRHRVAGETDQRVDDLFGVVAGGAGVPQRQRRDAVGVHVFGRAFQLGKRRDGGARRAGQLVVDFEQHRLIGLHDQWSVSHGATPPHRCALHRRGATYPIIRRRRHHRRDAVDGEVAQPSGRRIKGHQLAASYGDRRHHPLGGHTGGVEVADHQRVLIPCRALQQRHRNRGVDAHVAERCGGHFTQHRDDGVQGVAARVRRRAVAADAAAAWEPGLRAAGRRRWRPRSLRQPGRSPPPRSAASTSAIGAGDTATVGASARNCSCSRRRRHRLGQQRRVLAPYERCGHADPKLAMATRNVVDEIGKPLRHWCFRVAWRKAHASSRGFCRRRAHAGSTVR